jgi:hypothetical protein
METKEFKIEEKGVSKIEIPKFKPLTNAEKWQGIKERALSGSPENTDPKFGDNMNVAEYCDRMIERCICYDKDSE